MPSFSHESFSSKRDENGFRQRLSIDALKLIGRKPAHSDIYEGKAFSSGGFSDDKHQKKMLIKFLKDSMSNKESQDFASHTVNLRDNLESMAKEFNNSMKHMKAVKKDLPGSRKSNQIHFHELQMAQLESVSFWDKKRRKGEYFVFGEKLPGCKIFLDAQTGICEVEEEGKKRKRSKSVNYGDETFFPKNRSRTFSLRDSVSDEDVVESRHDQNGYAHDCLHAFVHFYFCHKNGEMAVDFLRGNFSGENGYTLITPTVHSLFRGYGPNDMGEHGIRRVIDCHNCNALCKHLPAMKDILNNAVCDGRTREVYENTGQPVNDQRYQQWAVDEGNWPSQDFQLAHNGSLYPDLSHSYGEQTDRETTLYSQGNGQCYLQSWQERARRERIEEAQQEINRCFS